MVKEVCPTTPPYRHLAQFVAAYRSFLDGYGTDTIETRPIGPTDIGLWEAYYLLMACPTCLAAVGEQRSVNEEHTDRRLGQLAANVFYHSEVQTPGGAWVEIALAVATEVLTDPEGYAHALGLPLPRHFYVCNGCGKEHPKGEPCPDAHLLDTAAQRLGWLLFQAGKTASGTAMDQYCELGMAAARELLSDPAGWARALGLPEPPTYTNTTTLLLKHAANQAVFAHQMAQDDK